MTFRPTFATAFVGVSLLVRSASAQAQEPPPATEPPAAALPPADPTPPPTPTESNRKACGLVFHSCRIPHLTLAIDGGVSKFNESGPFGFDTSIGSVSTAGPAWGVRAGIEILHWLAFDLHYSGMENHTTGVARPDGAVHLLTSAGTGEVRFTLPLPYVQPYLLAGAGVYSTSTTGSASAKAASPLHGSTQLGVPLGVGFAIPIYSGVSAGGEVVYHRFFGEEFAPDDRIGGGDLTTFNAVLRARL